MNFALKAELRDGETIRAYLDELVRLKIPIQLWAPHAEDPPFATTLEKVTGTTFLTSQTPPLQVGSILNFSFLLDAKRFTAATEVVATGTFRVPASIALGERRAHRRADFQREAKAEVFAVEAVADTFLGGATFTGKLLDMSAQGLRCLLREVGSATGPARDPRRGDVFTCVSISGLPYTPAIQCRGLVAHVTPMAEGVAVGLFLEGLRETDRMNLERVLEPRLPATYGQAFTRKKRRTDVADQVGAPTPIPTKAKAPEVVALPPKPTLPTREELDRPSVTALMKLRKIARRILVIAGAEGPGTLLAKCLREDGFKQVFEARSYMEAQALARPRAFDLLLLDLRIGGHSGQEMVEALRKNHLLVDTPLIAVAERRNSAAQAAAEALGAVHLHEKQESYEDLVPVLYALLLKG